MQAPDIERAIAATRSIAVSAGLTADEAIVVHDSNRLVLRLMPCDVIARVARVSHSPARANLELEAEIARRLGETGSPIAALDPRVEPRAYVRDGFVVNFWTYHEPASSQEPPPAVYAHALARLHAGLRAIDIDAPHFMGRVVETERDVANRDVTPDLGDADRELLVGTLQRLRRSILARGAAEQLLHGEPHPWNVHTTENGPLFIDFENCVRGPVEYDLAWVPEDVAALYPGAERGVDHDLLDECRGVQLAIVAACRWHRDDEHPSGRPGGIAYLKALRDGPPWPSIVRWED
jgi:hypothetical protein